MKAKKAVAKYKTFEKIADGNFGQVFRGVNARNGIFSYFHVKPPIWFF